MRRFLYGILSFSLLLLTVLPIHAQDVVKEYVLEYAHPGIVKTVDLKYHLKDKKLETITQTVALVRLTNQEKDRIKTDRDVKALVENILCSISAEITPWNITRVNATPTVWSTTTGDLVKVGVIDTGINLSHVDLKANIKPGINTINTRKSPNDDNGHGTHVAGIIGALDNDVGVIGVAPKADLYPIKVLNAAGSGTLADLIEGIQWAIDKQLDVISMSLSFGTATEEQLVPLHTYITKAYNAGITIVAAAGNSATTFTSYPARYPEVLSIAATDINDDPAYFNSVGKIDFSAPGVNIYSTYKKSYAYLSGTSMATPHVTGVVALIISQSRFDLDEDSKVEPAEVKQALMDAALDIGPSGFDQTTGHGLVQVPLPS